MTEQKAERHIGLGRFLPNIFPKPPEPPPIYDPIAEKERLEYIGEREGKRQAETAELTSRLYRLENFLGQQGTLIWQTYTDKSLRLPGGMTLIAGRKVKNE